MNEPKFKVCVRCITYNQAKYILDTLNGFTLQKTDFPFICCIVDDASTDGEQYVINEYLNEYFDVSNNNKQETEYSYITYAQHKSNKNCYFVVLYLKENHYSQNKSKIPYLHKWREKCKYEALCEGDDYWIDPLKLQKQFNLLESDNELGLVHTMFNIVDSKGNLMKENEIPDFYKRITPCRSIGYIYDKLFNNSSSILTCTVMYRVNQFIPIIDHDLFMHIAQKYKIGFLDDYSSCYRILPNSMMRSGSNRVNDLLFEAISSNMINFYINEYSEINPYYAHNDKLMNEVDLFFSKYITHHIKNGFNKCDIEIILKIMRKNPRLIMLTPYYIIRRLCSFI